MAAAVADFRPAELSQQKIKKGDDEELMVRLVRNPDILAGLADRRDVVKVGFAAETQHLLEYARSKLERKGLDMIVANEAVASIGHEASQVTLITVNDVQQLPHQAKDQTASAILDAVLARWPERLGPVETSAQKPM
jgi:phosphopantothenoylcysteine decarboxylase/phosphopantothenate--cysteine ligase